MSLFLIHVFLGSVSYNLHIPEDFLDIFCYCSLIILWFESILCMIAILNLVRFIYGPE